MVFLTPYLLVSRNNLGFPWSYHWRKQMADTREWCGLILEGRKEYGGAAHRNRGRYSGTKVHALWVERVVGLVSGNTPSPGSIGWQFYLHGDHEIFSSAPCCRCCQGQHAGSPVDGLTENDVTCDKCK